MGQNESTLNPGTSKPSQVVTEPTLEAKNQLPNQGNYYSANNRTDNITHNTNHLTKLTSKTPSNQARIFTNENRPLNERSSYLSEQRNGTNVTDRSRVSYSSRPGMNQVRRKNSEDFDMDLMEENTNIINQNANSRENTEGVTSSINSKPDSILNTGIDSKNYSGNNSFYTNKSVVNSQNVQSSQKSQIFQSRPVHKEILTVKEENMREPEEQIVFDGNIDFRKQQTFGKENNPLANEYLLRPPATLVENRAFHNDEVRIMETGFSSSRKVDSDYDQSPAMSARLQDELPKNIMDQINYIVPSKSKATSVSSTQSLPQHAVLKKQNRQENKDLIVVVEEAAKPYKPVQDEEKKSLYSILIEESQNPSPVKAKKSLQSQQDSKGFPDAEFSFKPNLMSRDRPRYSVENNSIQANSSRNKMLNSKTDKVLRKSRSQVSRKGLPAIEILESESCSSSYADGPVSTGSASSLSSVPHPYIPRNHKKRTHSTTNAKSSRRQSRALDQSSNHGAYSYVHNNYPQGQQHSFHGQSFHSMPQGPILTAIPTMAPVHAVPVMPAMDPYHQYMVNQPSAYYGNSGYQQIGTPMRNNYPIYYQNLQTPQVAAMPQAGVFSSPQFFNPVQPVQQNYPGFTSPSHYMNVPVPDYSRMNGRLTPHREPAYIHNRAPDSARAYYQGDSNLSMNYGQRTQDKSQEASGYKGLRSSKSLSTLKIGRQTPTNEPKMGVSRLDGVSYQNHSFTNMRSVSQADSMSRDPPGNGRVTPSALNNDDNSQSISAIGKISKTANNSMLENRTLNETTISRINDVSRAKKQVYPEETEGPQELNTTEYSLVQKLEGNGRENSNKTLSMMSSPGKKGKENRETKGRKNWQILNRIGGSKVNEKDEDVVLSDNVDHLNENNVKPGKKNKMEILLGSNNAPMSWEIKDFTSNKTPDLPRPKSQSSNQVLVFDAPKCRTSQSNAKSRQLPRYPNKKEESQKGIKLCFDLTEDFDDGGKKSMDDTNKTGEKSLADYFKKSKSSLASKLDEENRRFSTLSNNQTKEIDKEDLIQRRKDMLKSSSKKNQILDTMSSGAPVREFTQTPDLPSASYSGFPASPMGEGRRNDSTVLTEYSSNRLANVSRRNTRELNTSLMDRLAQGQKVKLSKKDMVALSTKNYQNLPEVKRRAEEKKRKEEKMDNLKKRQEKVKDLDARLRRPKSTNRTVNTETNNSYMG